MTRPLTLQAETATPESFAPFGTILGAEAPGAVLRSPFYGERVALRKPGRFIADETLEFTVATLERRPLRVGWMERHFLHTQTFFPLGGRPFLMVLAPPGEAELPDLSAARALLFDGTAAAMLHLGTWHEFPFPLLDATSLIIAIRRDTARDLNHVQGNEARGPDLDKKDIVARLGVAISVAL
jgi:ureidoglycolate lyase